MFVGGMFNPIIPFFESVPSWWERGDYRLKMKNRLINGYLDFFEPDFLVEAEEGISNGFGYDPKRVLQLTDILPQRDETEWDKYGLSVHELYMELYEKEFRFELRQKYNFVDVETASPTFANFVAANLVVSQFRNNLGIFNKTMIRYSIPNLLH